MNRPGLQALLVAIESGVIKAVLVYKFVSGG